MRPEEDPLPKAQAAVEAARTLLLAPTAEALDRSVPHLECALSCLNTVQTAWRAKPDGGVPPGLQKLRQSVNRAVALFQNAGGFYLGWAERLALLNGGYNAQGEPAVPSANGKLSVEG